MYHFHLKCQFENTLNKPRNTWTILELIYTYFFPNKHSHLEVQRCS